MVLEEFDELAAVSFALRILFGSAGADGQSEGSLRVEIDCIDARSGVEKKLGDVEISIGRAEVEEGSAKPVCFVWVEPASEQHADELGGGWISTDPEAVWNGGV